MAVIAFNLFFQDVFYGNLSHLPIFPLPHDTSVIAKTVDLRTASIDCQLCCLLAL